MGSPVLIVLTLVLGVCVGLLGKWASKCSSKRRPLKSSTPPPPLRISPTPSPKIEFPASPSLEAPLMKRATSHPLASVVGWQRRWFVATGAELKYFKDEKKNFAPTKVAFETVTSAGSEITLTMSSGTMRLQAETEQQAIEWVQYLNDHKRRERLEKEAEKKVKELPPASISGALPTTPEELEMLKAATVQFRQNFASEITEWCEKGSELAVAVRDVDRAVERLLWAREFDVPRAATMWRDTVKWRASITLDAALDKPYPEGKKIAAVFPGRYHGFDKLGRMVYIEDTGSLDLKALMGTTDIDGMMTYHLATMEFMCKYGLPRSRVVSGNPTLDQVVTILNLKNLNHRLLHPQAMKFLRTVMAVDQAHYPECLGKTFIVNAPSLFTYVWKIVKPLLAPRVMAKIEILGEVKEGSPDALADLIDLDQLPVYLGGTCACSIATPCPHSPGELTKDFLRLLEVGRSEFDREKNIPTHKLGFGFQ